MTGDDVLTFMRDHTKVATSGTAVVCVCGRGFAAPILHTSHVAEEIAAAITGTPAASGKPGRTLPARELGAEHLGSLVRIPADQVDEADTVDGYLIGLLAGSEMMLLELQQGDAELTANYRVEAGSWVEVCP